MAILLINHDPSLVRRAADRACAMHDGRIVEENARETLFRSPRRPYTQLLIEAESGGLTEPVVCREIYLGVRALSLDYPAPGGWLRRRTGLRAVYEVSPRLHCGSTLGIVGEGGLGKSSLGQALLHLLPVEGQTLLQGERFDWLHGKHLLLLRRQFQAMFQDPYSSLNPRLSVGQIVGESLRTHGVGDVGERRAQVLETLRGVSLDEPCPECYPHKSSGGQCQRITITHALVLKPVLVLLNEPTSALDHSVQCRVVELLRRLQHRHGLSYLFVSHDLAAARALAHDILILKDDRVVEWGGATALFSQPCRPYTRELLGAIPALYLEEHLRATGLGV